MRFDLFKNTKDGFEKFNNSVYNMPRPSFSFLSVDLILELSNLCLNFSAKRADLSSVTYIDIYKFFYHEIKSNGEKSELFKRESKMFADFQLLSDDEINEFYDKKGRDFRHIGSLCKLWGLMDENCIIDEDNCKELILAGTNKLPYTTRLLNIDIFSNNCTINLKNIKDFRRKNQNFNLNITKMIIDYIRIVDRKVSEFEICNLIGTLVDGDLSQSYILSESIKIGKLLGNDTYRHQEIFFKQMGWIDNNGNLFRYTTSQSPTFKFKSFLRMLEEFNIITISDCVISLNDEMHDDYNSDIPIEIEELDRYIKVAEDAVHDGELSDLIIRNTNPIVLENIVNNEKFIFAMNTRALKANTTERKRNKLISELAKAKQNYVCQISGKPTFLDKWGRNYVEAHHIIEFNGENGPDIVENILIINPMYHKLLHYGSESEIKDLYDHIRKNNIITIDLFKLIITRYRAIDNEHIFKLRRKGLISKIEEENLLEFIEECKINERNN